MSTSLQQLDALLREEVALHEVLRDDLAREVAQDGDMGSAELMDIQQRKYHVAHQIELLERRRLEQVRALAQEWETASGDLSLREIVERTDAPQSESFQGYHEALTALVEEIRALAKASGGNAQARLKAVEATLAVVGEAVRLHPTYSQAGRIRQRPPSFKQTSA